MFNLLILINVAYMLKQIWTYSTSWRHNLLLGSNLINKKIGAIWLLLSQHN